MELLGPSLEDLFQYCNKRFTIKTTAMLAIHLLDRMETLHSKNYVYRDVKPDNFLIGQGSTQTTIFMIDMGLVKRYKDPKTGNHIKSKSVNNLTGTARYSSTSAHKNEQSRKDDLEAIGYCLIYFLKGCLPWQGLQDVEDDKKNDAILDIKISTTLKVLCEDCPK